MLFRTVSLRIGIILAAQAGCPYLQVDAAALKKLRSMYCDEVKAQFEVGTDAGFQWSNTCAIV